MSNTLIKEFYDYHDVENQNYSCVYIYEVEGNLVKCGCTKNAYKRLCNIRNLKKIRGIQDSCCKFAFLPVELKHIYKVEKALFLCFKHECRLKDTELFRTTFKNALNKLKKISKDQKYSKYIKSAEEQDYEANKTNNINIEQKEKKKQNISLINYCNKIIYHEENISLLLSSIIDSTALFIDKYENEFGLSKTITKAMNLSSDSKVDCEICRNFVNIINNRISNEFIPEIISYINELIPLKEQKKEKDRALYNKIKSELYEHYMFNAKVKNTPLDEIYILHTAMRFLRQIKSDIEINDFMFFSSYHYSDCVYKTKSIRICKLISAISNLFFLTYIVDGLDARLIGDIMLLSLYIPVYLSRHIDGESQKFVEYAQQFTNQLPVLKECFNKIELERDINEEVTISDIFSVIDKFNEYTEGDTSGINICKYSCYDIVDRFGVDQLGKERLQIDYSDINDIEVPLTLID